MLFALHFRTFLVTNSQCWSLRVNKADSQRLYICYLEKVVRNFLSKNHGWPAWCDWQKLQSLTDLFWILITFSDCHSHGHQLRQLYILINPRPCGSQLANKLINLARKTAEVYLQWLYPCFKNWKKKKKETEGEEKDQEQKGKPVRPMVSCDLCYAISSYQCKLWIKEGFIKLKMIKKIKLWK